MKSAELHTSVILCTYNRCALLRDTLSSVVGQARALSAQVLVVDNNSTDQTAVIAGAFSSRDPEHVRYLFEPRPGLSFARNAGIRAAKGNLLVFVDDDVRLADSWLCNLVSVFADPEVMAAGGRIRPVWPERVPAWVGDRDHPAFPGAFVSYDQGDESVRLSGKFSTPLGANMAFRRTAFEELGGFRTDLGHIGGRPRGGEDMEMFQRVLARYGSIQYVPDAVVYHPVPRERLRLSYLFRYLYNAGISMPQYEYAQGVPRLLGIPRHLVRSSAENLLRAFLGLARLDQAAATRYLGRFILGLGYIRGLCALRNVRRPGAADVSVLR